MLQYPDADSAADPEPGAGHAVEHLRRDGGEPGRADIIQAQLAHFRADIHADDMAAVCTDQLLGQPPDTAAVIQDQIILPWCQIAAQQSDDIGRLLCPPRLRIRAGAFIGENDLTRGLFALNAEYLRVIIELFGHVPSLASGQGVVKQVE